MDRTMGVPVDPAPFLPLGVRAAGAGLASGDVPALASADASYSRGLLWTTASEGVTSPTSHGAETDGHAALVLDGGQEGASAHLTRLLHGSLPLSCVNHERLAVSQGLRTGPPDVAAMTGRDEVHGVVVPTVVIDMVHDERSAFGVSTYMPSHGCPTPVAGMDPRPDFGEQDGAVGLYPTAWRSERVVPIEPHRGVAPDQLDTCPSGLGTAGSRAETAPASTHMGWISRESASTALAGAIDRHGLIVPQGTPSPW